MTDENIRMIYDMSAERIRETDTAFYRYLYSQIDWDSRVVALDGPRGVGKTTMFLQHLKESADGSESALYISVDNVWLNAQELYELVQHHVRHGGTSIYIDEIHYLKDWQNLVKSLYDNFKSLKIAYTGSSILRLASGKADLSRHRYGVVRYNGGKIYKRNTGTDEKTKYNLYNSYDNATWENVHSYVDEGGFHLVNDTENTIYVNRPLLSGAANDGGVHYSSSKGRWISLSDVFTNSTFNGGTWLEGRVALINYREDAAFGAVLASPTDNIFFSGTPEYFGGDQNYTIHRNRNIKLLDGATATFGCNSEGSGLRIGGTISVPDGEGAAANGWDNWAFRISADHKSLEFKRLRGTIVIIF